MAENAILKCDALCSRYNNLFYCPKHTWFNLDAVIVVIVIVCALLDVVGERGVAGLQSTLGFPLACLNAVLLHSRRPVDAVQLKIETAGIAYRFTHRVTTPKRRHRCFTIAAREANAPRSRLKKYKIVITCCHLSPGGNYF